MLQTHQPLTIPQRLLSPYETSKKTRQKKSAHMLHLSPTSVSGQVPSLRWTPWTPSPRPSQLGWQALLPLRNSLFSPQSNRPLSSGEAPARPGPEAFAPHNPHPGLRARLGEPRSHCAEGADRSCQGAARPTPGGSPVSSPAPRQRPPAALRQLSCGPRDASAGERPAEQGLPPEPGAQAGAIAKNQNGCPRERSPAQAVRGCASPAPPAGNATWPAGPRPGTAPKPPRPARPRGLQGLRSPGRLWARTPSTARSPELREPVPARASLRTQPALATRT